MPCNRIDNPMAISAIWRRYRKNKPAVFGACIIVIVFIMAIGAPLLSPFDPYAHPFKALSPPNNTNWFGTDQIGRDILSRCIWGSRNSLMIGLLTSLLTTVIGTLVGAFSGYFKRLDSVVMRIADLVLVIPGYFFYILIIASLRDRSPLLIVLMMGALTWPSVARIVRSQFLSLTEMDYVKSAKSLGAGHFRIIFRHLLPNAMGAIIVVATMNIAAAILLESGLSFLGLTDPTIIGWGGILSGGRAVLSFAWWVATFPGLLLFLTVLAFNLVGDGLRDALDPRLMGVRV